MGGEMPLRPSSENRMPAIPQARLEIVQAPGGCLPGTLACDCDTTALAIWHPEFGAACSSCRKCWTFPSGFRGPRSYLMRPGPPVDVLTVGCDA